MQDEPAFNVVPKGHRGGGVYVILTLKGPSQPFPGHPEPAVPCYLDGTTYTSYPASHFSFRLLLPGIPDSPNDLIGIKWFDNNLYLPKNLPLIDQCDIFGFKKQSRCIRVIFA
jgi:hypothetical protein